MLLTDEFVALKDPASPNHWPVTLLAHIGPLARMTEDPLGHDGPGSSDSHRHALDGVEVVE